MDNTKEILEKTSISLNELTNSLGLQDENMKQIFLEELLKIILTHPNAKKLFIEPTTNLHPPSRG